MTTIYPLAAIRTQDELLEQAARLSAHSDFLPVWAEYTRKLLDYREESRPWAKLIANEDRYRTLNFLYTIWAEKRAAGGSGAVKYSELYEIIRRGEVTTRLLKTTLSLAVFSGFLDRVRDPDDGRSWLYKPTPKMIAFPQHWLMPAAEALDALGSDGNNAHRLETDPGVLIHFFRSAGREFAAGVQPMTLQADFMSFFGQKEGGAVFTKALLVADYDAKPPASRAEIAARYGLTKSQVSLLIATGQAADFVTVENGTPRPTAKLRDAHHHWIAISLAFLGHHLSAKTAA